MRTAERLQEDYRQHSQSEKESVKLRFDEPFYRVAFKINDMKRLEYFINLIFYQLFRFEEAIGHFIGYPFLWLGKRPWVIAAFKRHNLKNAEKAPVKASYRQPNGISTTLSDRLLTLLFFFLFAGTLNYLLGIFLPEIKLFKSILPTILYFSITFIPAYLVMDRFVSGKNKYLNYFKKFDRKSKRWHDGTAILSFFVVIAVSAYGIGSLFFYFERHFQ